MKYGFVIDNRKCIGCHACTTACKSEHEVPVGVNRTWVKQVEKGTFPDTRRLFSVMRCNHCTDAPCVTICPTESLYIREDGIVDFDQDRCIGCKSCMQACPYDALYIDPESNTAAKCNYCAHRIDIGLEPACVNVCPEHAIISGDMENPSSEISQILARQAVKTRKPEKATEPNLFYIDADDASLIPTATETSNQNMWGSQSYGVGHYAKEAEKMAFSSGDVIAEVMRSTSTIQNERGETIDAPKSVAVLMGKKESKRVYDTPDKGILWGWEVSGYVWTKAISTGAFIVPFIAWICGTIQIDDFPVHSTILTGIVFLTATGVLLVLDLDQPKRFAYVLLRPNWDSWLVKGGYSITVYGGLLSFLALSKWLHWDAVMPSIMYVTAGIAILTAIYTAFLFAQAKGRDFWQSPTLSIHMLVHSVMAGAAFFLIILFFSDSIKDWQPFLAKTLLISIGINTFVIAIELMTTHPTKEAKMVVTMITSGRYKRLFWYGAILIGNIIPFLLISYGNTHIHMEVIASVCVLFGIYLTEHIWVEAPQQIPLS